uniref:uncharacterized protein LOC100183544 isoform X2 n=1 Tax=Ciona intestinalis TaxID=7719 RepID=UPI000EF533C5|nr:uncharacterized protein LOC100183544 isoform X2 [Ciona intestinalis]|eukprot:XP_026690818.1 uncharacterized protein LOC100183544 isoform X2 [Ciona intestinalis]
MKALYEVVALSILFGLVCIEAAKDLYLSCNDACFDKLKPQSGLQMCNVTSGYPDDNRPDSVPMPKAYWKKNCSWYIATLANDDRVIALNLSWKEPGRRIGHKFHRGYSVNILPEASIANSNFLFQIKYHKKDLNRFSMVHMNYKCYGLNPENEITPGKNYYIMLRTLPMHKDYTETLYDRCTVYIPDCDDNADLEDTINCKATSPPIVHSCCGGVFVASTIVITMMFFLFGMTIYLCFVFFCRAASKENEPDNKTKTVLMVMSCHDNQPSKVQAADRLADCLNRVGMDVTFSLWKMTEITPIGASRWICNNIASYDHVVILFSSHKQSNRDSDLTDSDLYPVVYNMIRNGKLKDFSFVSLMPSEKKIYSFFVQPRLYFIPNEFIGLVRNISNRFNNQRILRSHKILLKALKEIEYSNQLMVL